MIARTVAISVLVGACVVWAAPARAQSADKAASKYERAAETTAAGRIEHVISVRGQDDTIGVHLDLKTDAAMVTVHVGPALFIGENNFWFAAGDQIAVIGALVKHDGAAALWARAITKQGATLVLRDENGAPRWKVNAADDPDGCGVSHAPDK